MTQKWPMPMAEGRVAKLGKLQSYESCGLRPGKHGERRKPWQERSRDGKSLAGLCFVVWQGHYAALERLWPDGFAHGGSAPSRGDPDIYEPDTGLNRGDIPAHIMQPWIRAARTRLLIGSRWFGRFTCHPFRQDLRHNPTGLVT